MPATLHKPASTGWRTPTGKFLTVAASALVLLSTVLVVDRMFFRPTPPQAASQPSSKAQRADRELCVEGAIMFYDVHWAAACARLAENGQSDGHADCELPPAEAERLNRMLGQAERACRPSH